MTPEQAIQILASLLPLAPVPLDRHQQGQAALQTLHAALFPKPAPAAKPAEAK